MRQDPAHNQGLLRQLIREIAASLKADWQRRVETDREKIEDILTSDPLLNKELGHQIKGWYKVAAGCASPPSRLTIKRIMADRVALHHHIPPLGENIPISVDPFPLD